MNERIRSYTFYETCSGPRRRMTRKACHLCPECREYLSTIVPPPFRWVVRARYRHEAYQSVWFNLRATDHSEIGIVWDREVDGDTPPPVGKNRRRYWWVISFCHGPAPTRWDDRQDAESVKAQIDAEGCGNFCTGDHELVAMTRAEARSRNLPCRGQALRLDRLDREVSKLFAAEFKRWLHRDQAG